MKETVSAAEFLAFIELYYESYFERAAAGNIVDVHNVSGLPMGLISTGSIKDNATKAD